MATAKGAGTTYSLEEEKEGEEVRSPLRLQKGQGRHTNWRWRGRASSQTMVATAKGDRDDVLSGGGNGGKRSDHGGHCKGLGMTYFLDVEREGKR